jgi:hypothetical protein
MGVRAGGESTAEQTATLAGQHYRSPVTTGLTARRRTALARCLSIPFQEHQSHNRLVENLRLVALLILSAPQPRIGSKAAGRGRPSGVEWRYAIGGASSALSRNWLVRSGSIGMTRSPAPRFAPVAATIRQVILILQLVPFGT